LAVEGSASTILCLWLGVNIGIFGLFIWYIIALFIHPLIGHSTRGDPFPEGDLFVIPFFALLVGAFVIPPVLLALFIFDLLPASWYAGGVDLEELPFG
jgi:hypothetical protein